MVGGQIHEDTQDGKGAELGGENTELRLRSVESEKLHKQGWF